MAPLNSSSKFVSVNLNKSYGQSTGAISNRPRTPGSHGLVVQLTRSKSQLVSSSPSLAAPRASNKLSVPRPVNLPSLRREHAGNDPTVSLVGSSGSSGWNKQQMPSQPGDPALTDLRTARSDTESSWRGKEVSAVDESNINEGKLVSHHTSFGRSERSPLRIQASAMTVERAVVLRGEDFPTLQAASRPPMMPSEQRHRDSQLKQQGTQREQHKMHRQQHTREQQEARSNSHMERGNFIEVQGRSMLLFKDDRRLPTVGLKQESKGSLAPLLRLNHTSKWGDDEREALDNFPSQGSDHSMRAETERLQGGYQQAGDWAVDYVASGDFMHPMPKYGLTPGVRRDGGVSLAVEGFKGHHFKNADYNVGVAKENHADSRIDLDARDRTGKRVARCERNESSFRGGSDYSLNMSFVNTSRQSNIPRGANFDRDKLIASENGPSRAIESKVSRVVDTAKIDADWDMYGQDLAPRGGEVGQHNVFLKDTCPSKHELDGGPGLEGHKFIRNSNTSYQYNGLDRSFTAQAGRQDPRIADYGRGKRDNMLYNHNVADDHFVGGILNARGHSSNVLMGKSGLEARVARRRKDEAQVREIRDAARESFEAELERVQKLQDQERQRMIEEHNLALERVRKEQEERERLAREEEQYRLELEQEARGRELKAQREAEEAAKKMEEDRHARELERQKILLEEQRRKEAARKKLLELEERIAKREAEKKQVEQATENVFEKVGFRNEDADWENQDNSRDVLTTFSKSDKDEKQMYFKDESFLVSNTLGGELVNGSPKLSPKISDSPAYSPEPSLIRSRTRVLSKWRQEKLDNGRGFVSGADSSQLHDGFSVIETEQDWVCERSSDLSSASLQERRPLELVGRKEPTFHNRQQHLSSNGVTGWSQEGSSSYVSGTETSDSSLFVRLRRSLPRQPRVPPPPTGPILQRHASVAKDTQQIFSAARDDSGKEASDSNKPLSSGDSNEVGGNDDLQLETHQLQSCTPEYDSMVLEVESLASDEKVGDALLDHPKGDNNEVSCSNADLESSIGVLDNGTSDVNASHQGQDLDQDQCTYLHDMEPDTIKQDVSIQPGDVKFCGASDCLQVDDVGDLANESTNASKDAADVSAAESFQDLHEFIDENLEYGDAVSGSAEEGRSIVEACHLVGLRKEDTMNLMPQNQGQENMVANLEHPCVQELDHANSEQDLIQASRTQHVSLLPMPGIMPTSLHMGHLEASASWPVAVQQFHQQPFSFMAMPLPQPTVPGSVVHPSILSASTLHPSPQNQQEAPFHLQLSLLPGPSVIPNAIQIGSIQMPLHIHSHLSHLSHMQGQLPPVFQFGQIAHSASSSQPLAIVQPVTVHHGTVQTSLSQHNDSKTDFVDIPGSDVKTVNATKVPAVIGIASKLNSCKDGPAEGKLASKTGCSAIKNKNEPLLGIGTVKAHIVPASSPAHTAQGERAAFTHPVVWSDSKGGKGTGGSWSYNTRGRGRGRGRGSYRSRKNRGVNSSYIGAERHRTENRHNGSARSRGRTFHRAEYRVRIREQPLQPSEWESSVVTKARIHQPNADVSNMQEALGKDAHQAQVYEYKKRTAEIGRKLAVSLRGTVITKGDYLNISSGISSSSHSKVYLKKYKPDNSVDAPLPTGIVRVYEQPGIEIQNDKDDFIEVRSKRQMLREQRQQREKENRSKTKAPKVTHKQRMAGVHNGVVEGIPSKHSINKQPGIVEQNSKESKLHINEGSSDNLNQGSSLVHNIGTSQALPVRSSSGAYIDKTSKSPRSCEAHGALESGSCTAAVNDKRSSILDNASTPSAWHGHRPQEVVSLMQIQLEEAMKPLGLEASSHQKHFLERASPDLALKNVSTLSDDSNIGLEMTTTVAKVSIPFPLPVHSLLAGEKIEFGAVTSPTLMSSSSHPTSLAPVKRTGSPLSFMPDMLHMYNSFTKSLPGSGMHLPFTSEDNDQGGEGQQDDGQGGVDSEAEAAAEAAASAVVVAAIGNDDSSTMITGTLVSGDGANASGAAFGSVRELSGASDALMGRGSNSTTAMDDSMSIALPADLSVETGPPLLQALSPSTPSSNFILPSLPGAPSPFPCLEMGTMLGGPIFTFGPRDTVPVEQGMASIGTGGLQGWQQRQSNSPDSLYVAPSSGYTGPFVNPTGLSGIQGHPQMLVYANPFTPVGQFGQLGVGFMGAAYHPSGKQPDWTHGPLAASSPGILGISSENPNPGHPGSAVLPIAAPLSIFDAGLSASFQVNPESSALPHWSKAPVPPLNNIPVLGPPPVLTLPHYHANILGPQLGQLPQLTDVNNGPQQMPVTNSSYSVIDVAAQFPDELGLSDSIASTTSAFERLSNSGLVSTSREQDLVSRGTNVGDEWSNSNRRKAIPGCNAERTLPNQKPSGFASPKLKQVYIAKPAVSLRKVDAHS